MENQYVDFNSCILCLLVACSSSDNDEPNSPQSNADIVFLSAGGTQNIEIGDNWTVDNPTEYIWCTISIIGSKMELTASSNTGSDSRKATYILRKGNTSKKVKILQYPEAIVSLSELPKMLPQKGGNIDVAIESNIPFEVSILEKDKSWIRCSTSRSTKLHFEVKSNKSAASRTAIITLIDAQGNVLLSFAISQKGDQAPNVIYYSTTDGSKIMPRGGFGGNFNILTHTYLDGQGTIVFDGNIFELETNAFAYSIQLTSLSLPEGITDIGTEAFAGCTNLTEINIPGSTKSIGVSAFQNCTSLKALNVPDNCQLYASAFEGSGLKSFIYPKADCVIFSIFKNCRNLKSVQLPDGIVTIFDDAFSGCTELHTVNIPTSLKQVNSGAFGYCESLESLSFGPNVIFFNSCFKGMTGNIRLYPHQEKHIEMLNGFRGSYEFPDDANPEYLLACSHYLEKEVRFSGKYASADGRCLIVDGKLYAAMLRDYDDIQYNFPKGIVKVMDKAVTIKPFSSKNASNIAFLFFADGLEEMGAQAFNAPSYDSYYSRATFPTILFPKSFKRFTGTDVLGSNIGWYAIFESTVPPELANYRLFSTDTPINSCKILVPSTAVDAYRTAWSQVASLIIAGSIDDFVMWEPYL